jgi:tetratricopeptide (TPR) repeat protein
MLNAEAPDYVEIDQWKLKVARGWKHCQLRRQTLLCVIILLPGTLVMRCAELSQVLKSLLLALLLCGLAAPALAQTARRSKAAPGKAAAESAESDRDEPDQQQAAALFEQGQAAHQAGRLEEAVRLYGEALQKDSSLWQAEYQRAAAYLALNRLAEARASITHVIEQLSGIEDSPELRAVLSKAHVTQGEILLAENKPAEAEPAFKRALELQPAASRAQAGLAQALFAGGKTTDALTAARAALAAGDDRAATHALIGAALVTQKKYDEALTSLTKALEREPQQAAALRYRAEVFIARKDLTRAAADLQASLTAERNTITMLRLADVYAQAGKTDEAIRLAKQILESEPENISARNLIAAATIESANTGEAIAQLEAMIQAEPDRADLRAQVAEKYLTSQPEKSLEQYTAAAKLEPQNPNHQIGVASALVRLRRFQEAISVLQALTGQSLKPEQAYVAHTNLATALFELKDYQNAAREFLWILGNQKDQKKTAITLYLLGICSDRLGDYVQALRAYEQFLQIAPPENQLEVDKVKLRLEPLRRQIEKSGGRKKK